MNPAPDRDEIIRTIIRYIDDYGWSWNVAKKLVNRQFGTLYSKSDIQSIYKRKKIKPPPARGWKICVPPLEGGRNRERNGGISLWPT